MIFSFSDLSIFGEILTQRALKKQVHEARRLLVELEHQRAADLSDEALKWKDYREVLALYGFKVALLLRKQGSVASLAFFATRLPRDSDYEVPEWMI